MRKLRHIFSFILPALLLLSSCSDEPYITPPGVKGDGSTILNLMVPSASMAREYGKKRGATATRADHMEYAELAAGEAYIGSLSVMAFYNDHDGERRHFLAELSNFNAEPIDDIYLSYPLNVPAGSYDLYICANVDIPADIKNRLKDLESDSDTLEEDVQKINLSELPTLADGLPMFCHKQIDVEEGNETRAEAQLNFACAKVRLTVLYNSSSADGDDAFSKSLGADKKMQMTGLTAKNVYTYSPLFADGGTRNATAATYDKSVSNVAASEGHYPLSLSSSEISNLSTYPSNGQVDPLDGIPNNPFTAAELPKEKFAYQAVCYLPECSGITNASYRTSLNLGASLEGVEQDPYEFELGCFNQGAEISDCGPGLQRGHMYDIIARIVEGGQVVVAWRDFGWNPVDLSVTLAGNNALRLGKTKIAEVTGEKPGYVLYETKSPTLTLTSDVADNGQPYFLLYQNRATGTIEVRVNPALGKTGVIENIGFWVQAGNIRKYVLVEKLDLTNYVTITPASQTIYISSIANEKEYQMDFQYGTNMDDIVLSLSSVSNGNTNTFKDASGEPRFYATIRTFDGEDYYTLTKEIEIKNGQINLSSYLKNADDVYPQGGLVTITIKDPTQQSFYAKEISGKITITAKKDGDTKSATASFNIKPNATVYTVHFKAIGSDNFNWDGTGSEAPHMYAYQPLEYKDRLVLSSQDNNGNWIEYSFTGKVAFKGWKEDGGDVDNLSSYSSIDYWGTTIEAYKVWGNALANGDFPTDKYNVVELLPSSFTDKITCSACKDARKQKWPGVEMQAEGNGWYKVELPLLAKPNKTLIMFAKGHNNGDNYEPYRYPGNQVPGIALPDYPGREAWYLYDKDKGGASCSFSDYPRESYDDAGYIEPEPDPEPEPTGEEYYLVSWKSTTSNLRCYINMWSESVVPFGNWDTEDQKEKYYTDSGSTRTYYNWAKCSGFNPDLALDGKYTVILHRKNNEGLDQSSNITFNNTNVEEMSSVPAAVITKFKEKEGSNAVIKRSYQIKTTY